MVTRAGKQEVRDHTHGPYINGHSVTSYKNLSDCPMVSKEKLTLFEDFWRHVLRSILAG